jgi:large subunit ribosomal protein L3
MIGLIGKKVGMTRLFGPNGQAIPATAILAAPCRVVQIKVDEKEGYRAVQLGAFDRRQKLVKKPQQGHFAKAGVEPKAKLAEFRVENPDLYRPGQEIRVNIFQEGDRIKVTGTSKGKGFAGGVKRWGFAGGPKSHGQSDRHRAPGSLGGSSFPSRVWKGQKMAGRMGSERVTVRNLEVVKVDLEQNLLLVKGAVPGARNGYLLLQRTSELTSLPTAPEPVQEAKKEPQAKGGPAKIPVTPAEEPGAPAPSEEETAEREPVAEPEAAPAKEEDLPEKSEQEVEAREKARGEPPTPAAEPETPAPSEEDTPGETSQKAGDSAEEGSTEEKKGKVDG